MTPKALTKRSRARSAKAWCGIGLPEQRSSNSLAPDGRAFRGKASPEEPSSFSERVGLFEEKELHRTYLYPSRGCWMTISFAIREERKDEE
ncbi:MAG: hypothetical protein C4334_00460 [Pyrinomonas sp.]